MRKLITALMLSVLTSGCNAQHAEKKTVQTSDTAGANKPQVSWKVNKQYDDKGNLISYDSTYVWTYSNKGGNKMQVDVDSVMDSFRKQFNLGFPSMFSKSFGDPVWNDSLFYRDFTRPDYFMHKWQHQYFDMNKMMRQMDSMRNDFLNKNYPGLNEQPGKIQNSKTI